MNRSHPDLIPLPPRRESLPMRLVALPLASTMLWSLGLAGAAQTVTYKAPLPPGHVRALTPDEMKAISGAQSVSHALTSTTTMADGAGEPWQGSVDGTNLSTGNKLTNVPLVHWTARGGLPVAFTLYHNSRSGRNAELGHKWSHSYDIGLTLNPSTGAATVTWGDGTSYPFSLSGGSYVHPAGVHDTLVQNVDGSYTLTQPDQTAYHFDATSLLCDSISDENGNTVTVSHNTNGTVSTVVDPTGRTLTLSYTSGILQTVTDPLSRVWTLHYNGSSELTQVDWPSLSGTTYSYYCGYNSAHDITSVTDLRGNANALTYNGDDSLATEADNAGNTTSYTYTSSTTTITDPNSHATVYTYDGSGRVDGVTDPLSHSEYYAYDTDNNKTQVEDKRGKYWNYTYNSGGDMLTAEDPLSHTTTYTYNSHHKQLTMTMPGGESVAYTYDSSDNLTQVDEKDASATTLATTYYDYYPGSYGLISDKTDADSHTTYYGYDTDGNLTSLTTPLGSERQWGYDGLGTLTSRIGEASDETDYTLDAWERVTTVTYPDSSTHTFTYDANSNQTQFVDGSGTTTRTYDVDDRMTGESKGGSTVVSHTYDATGKLGLLSTTTDGNSRTVTYAYTSRNQLYTVAESGTGAPSGTTTYTYDYDGNETGIANANGTTVTNVHDDARRLTSVTNKDSSAVTLSSFSYGYNSDDKRTSCTESSGDVVTYGYDGQLHLTSESRTGTYAYSKTYTVDGVGNRTAWTTGGVSYSAFYNDEDEPVSVYDVTDDFTCAYYGFEYGNLQWRMQRDSSSSDFAYSEYGYDYDDRMTSLATSAGADISYTYDAQGRRISRTTGVGSVPITTTSQYDGDAVLLEKQGTTVTASYTDGNALLRKDGETPLFDGLGSSRTVTDASTSTTATMTTDTFGMAVTGSGSTTSAYKFGGTWDYRDDGDDGLVQVGCRYYDPEMGRFTTRDTDLSQNAYVYCDGDPVNAVDLDGHAPVRLPVRLPVHAGVGGGITKKSTYDKIIDEDYDRHGKLIHKHVQRKYHYETSKTGKADAGIGDSGGASK